MRTTKAIDWTTASDAEIDAKLSDVFGDDWADLLQMTGRQAFERFYSLVVLHDDDRRESLATDSGRDLMRLGWEAAEGWSYYRTVWTLREAARERKEGKA